MKYKKAAKANRTQKEGREERSWLGGWRMRFKETSRVSICYGKGNGLGVRRLRI